LTGDIEKKAEEFLIENENLSSNIIIAPHHGSKTSGGKAFIEAVHPKMVLYSFGYRNRYHFPHRSVIQQYEAIHALSKNTMQSGAIQLRLPNFLPMEYRKEHMRYWNDVDVSYY